MSLNEKLMAPIQNAHTNPFLQFRDGQCLLSMVTEGGTKIERLISWESVKHAATGIMVDSGWLGPGVVRWGNGAFGEWVCAFIPPARWEIELIRGTPGEDESVERIATPLPGCVMFGISTKWFVFAVKTERFDPQEELYRCPLPNVYQTGIEAGTVKVRAGEICWGPFKPPQANPRSVSKAWGMFISSTFNNHSASGKSKRKPEDVRELLRDLAANGYDRYPVEDLVKQAEDGITLDKAIKQFLDTGEMPE